MLVLLLQLSELGSVLECTVMRVTNECYALDELLSRFPIYWAAVNKTEAPISLRVWYE